MAGSRFDVEDGRHCRNRFRDYSDRDCEEIINLERQEVDETFKKSLITSIERLVKILEDNESCWSNGRDESVYTGTAGIALMYHLLARNLKNQSYAERALELLKIQDKNRRVSFLAGSPGVLALGAVIYYERGNKEESEKWISRLIAIERLALDEKSNELLYGKAGYLYALLYVNANISSKPVADVHIKKIIHSILESGRKYSQFHGHKSPLMFEWHEKIYIGGAHGLAGILYILLQAKNYLAEEEIRNDIKPSLIYLESLQFPSGNFPSSLGNKTDKLVHWCHGAPSLTMLFSLAYKIFGDESFLQRAIECGEVVWSRGLLKAGYSLCHGVSGNAYAFIALYQQTRELKYLYRACKFAEWCMAYGKQCDKKPDRPFSLFEGLAGTIYFLADVCSPDIAKFPAYTL